LRPLTGADQEVIREALTAYRKAAQIPCTVCRYCMDCPEGVNIPRNLAILNDYGRLRAEKNLLADLTFKMETGLLGERERAPSCVSCGNCLPLCPQHIDIPRWLGEASGYLAALAK
jgi:predicted aldo/keto reductase-like oxidoreductase